MNKKKKNKNHKNTKKWLKLSKIKMKMENLIIKANSKYKTKS